MERVRVSLVRARFVALNYLDLSMRQLNSNQQKQNNLEN